MGVLESAVLVLNQGYSPIWTISVKRAILLIINGIAEAVFNEDDKYSSYDFKSWIELSEYKKIFDMKEGDWVHSQKLSLIVPRVVRLIKFSRYPKRKVLLTRKNIFYRDGNTCGYCGKKFSDCNLNIDHIIPKSRGGKDTWDNLICSCLNCNTRKSDRTPAEAKMKLLKTPIMPAFLPLVRFRKEHIPDDWNNFLSECYWNATIGDEKN